MVLISPDHPYHHRHHHYLHLNFLHHLLLHFPLQYIIHCHYVPWLYHPDLCLEEVVHCQTIKHVQNHQSIQIIIVTITISILTFFIICYFIFLFNILFTVTMFHDCIILICALRKLFTVKPLNMYKTINQFKSIIKKSIVGYSSIHIQLC